MGILENRIKAMESKLFTGEDEQPEGVFVHFISPSKDVPTPRSVKGWRSDDTRIMRMEGESDEELSKRAIAEIKPLMAKNAMPVFTAIIE